MLLKSFLFIFCWAGTLATSFELGGVISGNRMAGVPLGISLGHGELDVEGICSESGMACQNCTHAVTCVALPVGWLKVPLQECPEHLTCNAHLGTCSDQAVPECNVTNQKYEHTCEQVGIFPDAFDCRKFHLCSPPDGLPDGRPADHRTALCPRHYGYNPLTAQCSIKLNHGQCNQKPVPDCTTVGQIGVLPLSPNHYYVCLVKNGSLYPQIFICPHGWYFWDNFCHPEPENEKTVTEKVETNEKIEEKPGKKDAAVQTEKGTDSSSEESKEQKTKVTTTKIESFFSTEKATTIPADTFLADKFDLSNYESTDDVTPAIDDEFANSFETGADFWSGFLF